MEFAGRRGRRRDHPPSRSGHCPRLPGKGPGIPGRMGAVAWRRGPAPSREPSATHRAGRRRPGNRNSLVTLLTCTAWQDVSPWTIERVLANPASPPAPPWRPPGYGSTKMRSKADRVQALWLYAQMVEAGLNRLFDALAEAAAAVYAPALGPPISRPAATPVLRRSRVFVKRYCFLPRGLESQAPKLIDACVAQ